MTSRRRLMMASQSVIKGSVNGIIQDDWKTIGKICAKGPDYVKKYYKVGDVKPIPIEGEGTIDYEIIGIGVQDKADGTGKAAISWFSKRLLSQETYYGMKPFSPFKGYEYSDLRSYLNDTLFTKLPADLQAIIVTVSNSDNTFSPTQNRVWTVGRADFISGGIFDSTLGTADQRIRKKPSGDNRDWWLRDSPASNNQSGTIHVSTVTATGGVDNLSNINTQRGVAFGFAT